MFFVSKLPARRPQCAASYNSRHTFSISTVPQPREKNGRREASGDFFATLCSCLPPAATAGKRFVLKTCGSPTWDSQNILYMHAPEYNANLKMAQDNFEGNLCLAATGSVNEDVIETAICDGNDKYQAWQLKVIEELPQHLDDEYGGH